MIKITSNAFEENEPIICTMNAIQILLLGWCCDDVTLRRKIESLTPKRALKYKRNNGVWIKFSRFI